MFIRFSLESMAMMHVLFKIVVSVLFFVELARTGSVQLSPATPVPAASPVLVSSATTLDASYVLVLNQSAVYNETVSVPVGQRLDTTAPLPSMVVADDFTVPTSLQTCRLLIADLVLLRQLGRVATSNYRTPANVTLWLFGSTSTAGPFDPSRALFTKVFSVPSEGAWDPVGSTGGKTVDNGGGFHYHLERLRFQMSNVTLRAGLTYWLAALVSIERAYNATDFSQNSVRWALSEVVPGVGSLVLNHPYRVVDWHGNMFRAMPALHNWSAAAVAESTVLPSFVDPTTLASATRQLAVDIYLSRCTNVTRLPTSIKLLSSLPPRYASSAVVSVATPESPPASPVVLVITPEGTIVPSTTTSSWPSSSPLASSSSSRTPVPTPIPINSPIVVIGNTPAPTPVPVSATDVPTSAEPVVVIIREKTPLWTWIFIGGAAFVFIGLCAAVVWVLARKRYTKKFTDERLVDVFKENGGSVLGSDDEDADSRSGPSDILSEAVKDKYTDKPSILPIDEEDVELEDVPTTPGEAAAQQDFRLMRTVNTKK